MPAIAVRNELPSGAAVHSPMKPNPPEKDPRRQLKTFEQQSPKVKEVERIKDDVEKSTGKARVESTEAAGAKSRQPESEKRS